MRHETDCCLLNLKKLSITQSYVCFLRKVALCVYIVYQDHITNRLVFHTSLIYVSRNLVLVHRHHYPNEICYTKFMETKILITAWR